MNLVRGAAFFLVSLIAAFFLVTPAAHADPADPADRVRPEPIVIGPAPCEDPDGAGPSGPTCLNEWERDPIPCPVIWPRG
jgi:hypothetical protein